MMLITGFKKQGRRFPKIIVSLDGQPWATLDPETVVRERLATGQSLSETRRREVLLADEVVRARKAAGAHAARGPKTRLELETFLEERGFGAVARRRALAALTEAGIINDETVAGRVVRGRRRRRDVGPLRLEAELRQRGIDSDVAGRRVGEALAGADLASECLDLARRFAKRYQPLADPAQRRKLAGALLRRGYESEHVWSAINKLCTETGISAEED